MGIHIFTIKRFEFVGSTQKREIRNYCQSAMVSDFFCFSVISHDTPRFVASCKITAYIDDFPNHPFLVKDDESMAQLIKSIEMNGVLNPVIARKKEGERYELI